MFSYVLVDGKLKDNDKSAEKFYREAFRLAAVEIFSSAPTVRLIVEQRNGVSEAVLSTILKDLHLDLESTVLDLPILPLFCPKILLTISDKSEPGLQVVDFLLWACARALSRAKDRRWLERLNAAIRVEMSDEGKPVSDGLLHLNWSTVPEGNPYPPEIEQDRAAAPDDYRRDWSLIERTIRTVASGDSLPIYLDHLAADLALASSALASRDLKAVADGVRQIASAFLRLFDTMPVYGGVPNGDLVRWRELLSARRLAASMLDGRHLRSVRLRGEIIKLRRTEIRAQAGKLEGV
jgi:hypothetical protein